MRVPSEGPNPNPPVIVRLGCTSNLLVWVYLEYGTGGLPFKRENIFGPFVACGCTCMYGIMHTYSKKHVRKSKNATQEGCKTVWHYIPSNTHVTCLSSIHKRPSLHRMISHAKTRVTRYNPRTRERNKNTWTLATVPVCQDPHSCLHPQYHYSKLQMVYINGISQVLLVIHVPCAYEQTHHMLSMMENLWMLMGADIMQHGVTWCAYE